MADVSIQYKGSAIAEMSESGTKTLETGGTYCEDDITVSYTQPEGVSVCRGSFTLAVQGYQTPVITHNLGTKKIVFLIFAENGESLTTWRTTVAFGASWNQIFPVSYRIDVPNHTAETLGVSSTVQTALIKFSTADASSTDLIASTNGYDEATMFPILTENTVQIYSPHLFEGGITYRYVIYPVDTEEVSA